MLPSCVEARSCCSRTERRFGVPSSSFAVAIRPAHSGGPANERGRLRWLARHFVCLPAPLPAYSRSPSCPYLLWVTKIASLAVVRCGARAKVPLRRWQRSTQADRRQADRRGKFCRENPANPLHCLARLELAETPRGGHSSPRNDVGCIAHRAGRGPAAAAERSSQDGLYNLPACARRASESPPFEPRRRPERQAVQWTRSTRSQSSQARETHSAECGRRRSAAAGGVQEAPGADA